MALLDFLSIADGFFLCFPFDCMWFLVESCPFWLTHSTGLQFHTPKNTLKYKNPIQKVLSLIMDPLYYTLFKNLTEMAVLNQYQETP